MMHDEFCPALRADKPEQDRSWNVWQCQCALIDGVREDAVKTAMKAIMSIPYTEIDGVPLVIRQEAIEEIGRRLHAPGAGS